MGEAKRKKQAMLGKPSAFDVSPEDREIIASAIRKVVGAVTDFHGADCIMYTQVGVEILRRRGFDACARAGNASWRVGAGDGDVVAHVEQPGNPVGVPVGAPRAGLFHTWIEVGDVLIDFTTHALRDKARMLDAMDGGSTVVDWSPSYLWIDRRTALSHRAVATAPSGGAYSYERNARIEGVVFAETLHQEDVESLANNVDITIRALASGNEIKVVGMGGGAPQDMDSARFMSQAKGMMPVPRG